MFSLSERVVGFYPLSMATSLAVEGALGNHPEKPTNKNVLSKINDFYINVDTLIRNIYNAVPTEFKNSISSEDMAQTLYQEVESFIRVLSDNVQNPKIVFYRCSKELLKYKHPNAILRQSTTPNQLIYDALRYDTLLSPIINDLNIRQYDLVITDTSSKRTAVLTHQPYEMFSYGLSNRLLWESHTGVLKGKSSWYTKFYNGKELQMIPFCVEMIQIFGDNEYFRPISIKYRKAIIDVAIEYGWSQVTTKEKILYSINTIEDKEIKQAVREFII